MSSSTCTLQRVHAPFATNPGATSLFLAGNAGRTLSLNFPSNIADRGPTRVPTLPTAESMRQPVPKTRPHLETLDTYCGRRDSLPMTDFNTPAACWGWYVDSLVALGTGCRNPAPTPLFQGSSNSCLLTPRREEAATETQAGSSQKGVTAHRHLSQENNNLRSSNSNMQFHHAVQKRVF